MYFHFPRRKECFPRFSLWNVLINFIGCSCACEVLIITRESNRSEPLFLIFFIENNSVIKRNKTIKVIGWGGAPDQKFEGSVYIKINGYLKNKNVAYMRDSNGGSLSYKSTLTISTLNHPLIIMYCGIEGMLVCTYVVGSINVLRRQESLFK